MAGINLTNNFSVNTNLPIDSRYFAPNTGTGNNPWVSVGEVNANIPIFRRYKGLPVNINGEEYWYKDGVEDGDLVLKTFGGGGSDIVSLVFNNIVGNTLTLSTDDTDYEVTIDNLTNFNVRNLNITSNGGIRSYNGVTDLSGQFLSGTTNGFVLAPISDLTVDTQVTGFTYNGLGNLLTLTRNYGLPNLTAVIDRFNTISVTSLDENKLIFANATGDLLSSSIIYNPSSGDLSLSGDINALNATFTENVTVLGDLTVLGVGTSAFTNNLFIEDNVLTLNYNPTGSTAVGSLGAGISIQDGSGVINQDVSFIVRNLNTLVGINGFTPNTSEYTGVDGYGNRGWVTQLNDIVIRSNNTDTPSGVRVLTEFDILDAGQY